MTIRMWEVVRTVELEPFVFDSGDSLQFRIEVQRQLAEPPVFRARVWRVEGFQIRPMWPDGSRESTELLLLNDDSYTGSADRTSPSADEVLSWVLAELERQFGAGASRGR
jgi:hypothetical protein